MSAASPRRRSGLLESQRRSFTSSAHPYTHSEATAAYRPVALVSLPRSPRATTHRAWHGCGDGHSTRKPVSCVARRAPRSHRARRLHADTPMTRVPPASPAARLQPTRQAITHACATPTVACCACTAASRGALSRPQWRARTCTCTRVCRGSLATMPLEAASQQ